MKYERAKRVCKRHNGIIVEPIDQEKNDEMIAFARSKGIDTFWIGLTDRAVEGVWVWAVNGQVSWTNWGPGQPSTRSGDVALVDTTSGEWRDERGRQPQRVLCQPEI